MAQYRGEVAWFNNAGGFGFLKPTTGADVFCHYSAIQIEGYKSIRKGELVEFDIVLGAMGRPQADNVRLLQMRNRAA